MHGGMGTRAHVGCPSPRCRWPPKPARPPLPPSPRSRRTSGRSTASCPPPRAWTPWTSTLMAPRCVQPRRRWAPGAGGVAGRPARHVALGGSPPARATLVAVKTISHSRAPRTRPLPTARARPRVQVQSGVTFRTMTPTCRCPRVSSTWPSAPRAPPRPPRRRLLRSSRPRAARCDGRCPALRPTAVVQHTPRAAAASHAPLQRGSTRRVV